MSVVNINTAFDTHTNLRADVTLNSLEIIRHNKLQLESKNLRTYQV